MLLDRNDPVCFQFYKNDINEYMNFQLSAMQFRNIWKYLKYSRMQHYQLHPKKQIFIVLIGTIYLLTINMREGGRMITHLQIPRFNTKVWYKPKT